MKRVYNFSAGPAMLPEEVLQEAAAEMLDYRGTGMSVMEMSHRSKAYQQILDEATMDANNIRMGAISYTDDMLANMKQGLFQEPKMLCIRKLQEQCLPQQT